MLNRLQKEIISLARNCSKNGFIINTRADIIFLKMSFNLTYLELCEVLEDMKYNGLLKEFKIQYSGNGTIYRYWFK